MISLCLALVAPASALVASAPSTLHRCSPAWRSGQPVARVSSRREALSLGAAAAFLVAAPPRAAFASLDPNDMTRFRKALDGVNYLLDNWDTETTECTTGGEGKCTDQPDKVRYYFGLRTTDHPLFQLDKLYAKAQDRLPDDADFEAWIEATEGLASQIAKINELAYTYAAPIRATDPAPPCPLQRARLRSTRPGERTLARRSSFGEYNPGGGKEQIRKYLLLCQEQVIKSKSSLETIVKLLNV